MSRGARLGLIAAAIAVAVGAFLIARPGDDDKNDGGGGTRTVETTARAPEPQVETIRVRGGEAVGGVKELRVEKDEQVRLDVTADVSDEVHVHGYDVFEDVRPGRVARLRFKADLEGIFEVELEGTHTPIAELRVEP